jgi:hypothetical protein
MRSIIAQGTTADWNFVQAAGFVPEELSVEDIFVALVGTGAIVA